MKNLIRKILKEETKDFEWADSINPLSDFNDYFYGIGDYEYRRRGSPGLYIKRDSSWWYNWIEDVENSKLACFKTFILLHDNFIFYLS